jgi:hypothetical protein
VPVRVAATDRIRTKIDALFAEDRELPEILNDPTAWTQPRLTNGRRLRGYGCVTELGNGPTFGRTSLWKHKAF